MKTGGLHAIVVKITHSIKNNLLCTNYLRIVWLSSTYEGHVHDKKICDEEPLLLPKSIRLWQDTGFIGHMNVIRAEQDGESTDVSKGYIYMRLNEDRSYRTTMFDDCYIGTYKLEGNAVVGTTKDPITEYYKFTSLDGNNANIDYSNSVGDRYKFKAVKR